MRGRTTFKTALNHFLSTTTAFANGDENGNLSLILSFFYILKDCFFLLFDLHLGFNNVMIADKFMN